MKLTSRSALAAALLSFACIFSLATLAPGARAQRKRKPQAKGATATPSPSPTATQVHAPSSILLRWRGEPGIERYRLQLARDAKFEDIVFDRAVVGREYRVTGLAPGSYFWHVAPAAGETGAYSRPAPVDVTGEGAALPAVAAAANVITPSNNTGWRTATGEMMNLVAANLRAGKGADLVSVNRDGTTYALDGANGVAMWTARFRPNALRSEETTAPAGSSVTFEPLIVGGAGGASNVVVAFEGGVRALNGETGREAWRAPLAAGNAASGVAADLDGDGKQELAVVGGSPSTLYFIDTQTGKVISQTKLDATVVGAPVAYSVGDARGVVLSLDNSSVEVRGMKGEQLRSVKLDAALTTGPIMVASSHGLLLTVGSEKGLDALQADDLKPLGRIVTENDVIRGTLSAADLDGDGMAEIVLVTRNGRVAVVGTGDGKIMWFAEGALDAAVASFADVNGDGTLDVLVPAGAIFALGFSGRDGTLIWKAEDEGGRMPPTVGTGGSLRSLAMAPSAGDAGFLVGGEPSRTGLRAVELPKGAIKTATR